MKFFQSISIFPEMGQEKSKLSSSWIVSGFRPTQNTILKRQLVPSALRYFTLNPPEGVCSFWNDLAENNLSSKNSVLHSIPIQKLRGLSSEWKEKFLKLYQEKYAVLWKPYSDYIESSRVPGSLKLRDFLTSASEDDPVSPSKYVYTTTEPLDFEKDDYALMVILSDKQWEELKTAIDNVKNVKDASLQQHLDARFQ